MGQPPHTPEAGPAARSRARTTLAVVLITLGCLLVPVALVTSWGRATLIDTDGFVATYAPLARDEAIQAMVIDEVTTVIVDSIELEQVTSDLIDALEPRPRVRRGLEALQGPIVRGLSDTIESAVARFVRSDAFASAWVAALRVSHAQINATLSDDPGTLISARGEVIGLELGPIVEAAKNVLLDQGFNLASRIPEVQRTVPFAESDQIPAIRTIYEFIVAAGVWLPILAAGLLIVGVAVARRRTVALTWAALGLAASMLVLLAGTAFAGAAVVSSVGVHEAALRTLFDAATGPMSNGARALLTISVTVALASWFAGPTESARAVRGRFGR